MGEREPFDMRKVAALSPEERERLRAEIRAEVDATPCTECGHTWAAHDTLLGCACGCAVRIVGGGR